MEDVDSLEFCRLYIYNIAVAVLLDDSKDGGFGNMSKPGLPGSTRDMCRL